MRLPLILTSLVLAAASARADVAFVEAKPKKKQPIRVVVHDGGVGEQLGPKLVTSKKLGHLGGKNPTRAVLAIDFDGDGKDELVRVTERVEDGRLDLTVLSRPKGSGGKIKTLASAAQGTVGSTSGATPVLCVGVIDQQGDNLGDLLLVHEAYGSYSFRVRPLPSAKNEPLPDVVAEASTWPGGTTGIRAVTGLDVDDDPADEVVVVFAMLDGTEAICVYDSLIGPMETLPAVTPLTPLHSPGGTTTALSPIDHDDDGARELLVSQSLPNGGTRMVVYAPQAGAIGPALADTSLAPSAKVHHALGIDRTVGPEDDLPAPTTLEGELHVVRMFFGGDVIISSSSYVCDVTIDYGPVAHEVTLPDGQTLTMHAPPVPFAGPVWFEEEELTLSFYDETLGSGTLTTSLPAGAQVTHVNGTWIHTEVTSYPPPAIGLVEFAHGWSPEIHALRLLLGD